MTERQVGRIDRHSTVPRSVAPFAMRVSPRALRSGGSAVEPAVRSAYLTRCCGLRGRPGSRRDRVVRWSFKVRDGCCQR